MCDLSNLSRLIQTLTPDSGITKRTHDAAGNPFSIFYRQITAIRNVGFGLTVPPGLTLFMFFVLAIGISTQARAQGNCPENMECTEPSFTEWQYHQDTSLEACTELFPTEGELTSCISSAFPAIDPAHCSYPFLGHASWRAESVQVEVTMGKFGCNGPDPCPNNEFFLGFARIRDPYCTSGFSLGGNVCLRPKYAPTCDPERHPQVGNPVATGSGDKLQEESDFASYGNFPIGLSRFYSSRSIVLPASSRMFGANWTTVHDLALAQVSETQVWALRANGRALYFNLLNGRWMPGVEQTEQLIELQDNSGLRVGWQLTGKDDTVERYDAAGRLLSRSARGGLTHLYDYSDGSLDHRLLDEQGLVTDTALPAGRLVKIRDTFGRFVTFSYNTRLLVARVTDPASAVYRYGYDANGNLSAVTSPDGSPRTYHYFALSQPDYPHESMGSDSIDIYL